MSSIGIRLDNGYQLARTTWQRPTPWRVHESYPDTTKTTYGMTANATGVLDVTASLTWTNSSNEQRSVRLTRNGTVVGAAQSSTSGTFLNASWPGISVVSGDQLVIECYAVQTLGAQRTIATGSSLVAVQRPEPPVEVNITGIPTLALRALDASVARSSQPVVVNTVAPVVVVSALRATTSVSAAPNPPVAIVTRALPMLTVTARRATTRLSAQANTSLIIVTRRVPALTLTVLAATTVEAEPTNAPVAQHLRVLMPVARTAIAMAEQRARVLLPTKRRSVTI